MIVYNFLINGDRAMILVSRDRFSWSRNTNMIPKRRLTLQILIKSKMAAISRGKLNSMIVYNFLINGDRAMILVSRDRFSWPRNTNMIPKRRLTLQILIKSKMAAISRGKFYDCL